ncbi:MAG: hypothetical protein IBX50_08405 [Marinospirillum sp.]|uniref:hypothetical protein n=1 Tax=Marinospirillum sp. TaxID=2183934 RepID=UPI001A00E654|nr:hypothetical protein [Marinospirillum sp.]MBE0506728.1 hypothetical protein [Marinospirillum sp.]
MKKTIGVLMLMAGLMLLGGCSSVDRAEQERRAAYEQSREEQRIDRLQREADAAARRMDEQLKK